MKNFIIIKLILNKRQIIKRIILTKNYKINKFVKLLIIIKIIYFMKKIIILTIKIPVRNKTTNKKSKHKIIIFYQTNKQSKNMSKISKTPTKLAVKINLTKIIL
jgi:hypothetical protein